jgi:hypothetical protein
LLPAEEGKQMLHYVIPQVNIPAPAARMLVHL